MTSLALIIIGILAGLLIATLAGSTVLLAYIAWCLRRESALSAAATRRAIIQSTMAMDRMRGEVSLALSSMDAQRIHEAGQTIQHNVRQLQSTVGALGKLVFNAGISDASMGLDQPQPSTYDSSPYIVPPPPSAAPYVQRDAPDPFAIWRQRKQEEAHLATGATDQIAVTRLPDMQQPDGMPLDDDQADAYLSNYIERQPLGDVEEFPGMTDGSDGGPVERG